MPRNRASDDVRQPILQENDEDVQGYQDNELEQLTCCNPSKSWFRFVALIFMCLVGFGRWTINHRALIKFRREWVLMNAKFPQVAKS